MRLSEFTGARRVPLIGRRDLLQEAERRIGRGGVHLIYVEGVGGIGKTALLEAILERSQRSSRADTMAGCCVAQEVIDLYHADVHTVEGLIRRLMEVLGRWSFEESQRILVALDRVRVVGDMDAAREHARALESSFVEEFTALTDVGVVLALDTMEVLRYEHDPFQDELGEEAPVPSAGQWLFQSFLPALRGNALVLVAGRPAGLPKELAAVRQKNSHLLIHHIQLEALNKDETKEYLRAVAQAEGRRGDGDAATRLWSFSEQCGDTAYLLTEGRPILLALVADMVVHDWPLPTPLDKPLKELTRQDVDEWWPDLEKGLVVRMQESPTPLGTTIRTLAWLRKGATPELLAQVMDLRTDDGAWDIYTAAGYLDQVAELAWIKVRPGDRRIYLHDEMYALLEKHVLQDCSDEERDRTYAAIQAYYRNLTHELEQRSEQLPPALASVQARLRQAFVEGIHYRLRHSPSMGFAMYFWLAEEALAGRDSEMDMLVRTEFLRTLALLKESGHFLGTIPREAEVDAGVRWGMRALFLQGDTELALSIFDRVRRRWGRQAGKLKLAWAHLQLYRAVARIRRAGGDDWQEARKLLASVEETMDEVLRSPPENPVVKSRLWRARIIKSLALASRGYLDRQQGRYLEAVKHYQESAMLQRRLGMAALAPTLTSLAHVMALTGEFHHARLLAEEAERLTRRRGKEHMLALTLNVRALVEGYDDHHKTALRYTDQALEIAAELPTERVRGLIYLTRARAYRYLWRSLTERERKAEPNFFDGALRAVNQAVNLLRKTPADKVEALLERGCIYSELARQHHVDGNGEKAEEFAEKSREDLERVAALAAAIDLPRQQALAWTNLGWLCYHIGRTREVRTALRQAYRPFPSAYLFPDRGPLPPLAGNGGKHQATLPYWSTLGKAEMLKAYLALDRALDTADKQEHEAQLQVAVKHITLSLAYDELVANLHFDLAKAEEALHKRIIQNGLSIKTMHHYAQKVAEAQGLRQPTRFQEFLSRIFGPADLWA